MTTVDKARAALLRRYRPRIDDANYERDIDALIAAVRAESDDMARSLSEHSRALIECERKRAQDETRLTFYEDQLRLTRDQLTAIRRRRAARRAEVRAEGLDAQVVRLLDEWFAANDTLTRANYAGLVSARLAKDAERPPLTEDELERWRTGMDAER